MALSLGEFNGEKAASIAGLEAIGRRCRPDAGLHHPYSLALLLFT